MGRALKLLLDTHALLWWWDDDARLSKRVKKALTDEANVVLVSAASAWEIATKHRIGKLPGAQRVVREFNDLVVSDGFGHLAISYQHSLHAGAYASAHRDPFDRMLAAQAEIESALLVSNDAALKSLGVKCYWS